MYKNYIGTIYVLTIIHFSEWLYVNIFTTYL